MELLNKKGKNELAHMTEGLENYQMELVGEYNYKFTRKLLKALVGKGFSFDPDMVDGARLADVFEIVGNVQTSLGEKLDSSFCKSIAKHLITSGLVKNIYS